ncbi:MAG: hypothetical protein K6T83_24100 [Alicyclobacillus sp.]|nr:hypothetical protein [Alicyclobacillus sp.]
MKRVAISAITTALLLGSAMVPALAASTSSSGTTATGYGSGYVQPHDYKPVLD